MKKREYRFPQQSLSPMGKAKRRRIRRRKRKPTPPRCARQPLPREGARVDTPSFLWKEVPRRGGGWMGKAAFSYLPPFSGRRCPEGTEARSRYRLKKNVRYAFPRIVIPSAAEGSFSFPVSLFLRNAVCMKHRDPTSQRVRCFPLSAVLTFPDRSRMKKISRFRSK